MLLKSARRRGLTLVELLAVVAIIGILIVLTLPAILAVREAARRAMCQNHLKQLGVALHAHHGARSRFPPGGEEEWSWIARILPHLEEHSLYEQLDLSIDPFIPPNDQHSGTLLPVLLCPSDPRGEEIHVAFMEFSRQEFAHTNYLGTLASGPSRGMFPPRKGLRIREVVDGTSKTLFVGERGTVFDSGHSHGWWVWGITSDTYLSALAKLQPGRMDDHASAYRYWSHHPGGAHFLMVDGGVRMLTYEVDPTLFAALATRDGHESVSLDD